MITAKPRGRPSVNLRILPSSMSVLAICAGLTSIRFALVGQPHAAMALIAAAAILDGLDGGWPASSTPSREWARRSTRWPTR
ncbi:CDP-diacylglycerol--serine O-phosphatidyltransferase domain protein [Mycobacterium xenopi 4042]|uniref:CDP-diacylglycerol--serine O-phosphatidyltransferase domain protein n=1 Tax=Mycobacterium xenopi 4042 TaxID=1299334 RepID=X8DK76_MYCXE|nr:CDP-diacylglycerol--serine O-phosphatidyltransferase domain protein [Mycobacterium xenopi 4042]